MYLILWLNVLTGSINLWEYDCPIDAAGDFERLFTQGMPCQLIEPDGNVYETYDE